MPKVKLPAKFINSIVPIRLGGNGRSDVLALIGDKLIDLTLYVDILRINTKNARDAGEITAFRSKLVSNRNLAVHAETICVPKLVIKKDFDTLSVKEKGTMVEAYMGALFESSNFKLSVKCKREVMKIIEVLKTTVGNGDFLPAKSRLLIKIQKEYKITIPIPRYLAIKDLLVSDLTRPKFQCTFDVTKLKEFKGTPFASFGCIVGKICSNHRDAEDSVSSMVLSKLEEFQSSKGNLSVPSSTPPEESSNGTIVDEDEFMKIDTSNGKILTELSEDKIEPKLSEDEEFVRVMTEVYGAREQEVFVARPNEPIEGWTQNPKKLLHNLFGACGLSGADFAVSVKITRLSNIISQASFKLVTAVPNHCFPDIGVIKGKPKPNKKQAEQSLCARVLDLLVERGEPKISYFREMKAHKVSQEAVVNSENKSKISV